MMGDLCYFLPDSKFLCLSLKDSTLLALLKTDTIFMLSVLNCSTIIVMHYCLDYTIK